MGCFRCGLTHLNRLDNCNQPGCPKRFFEDFGDKTEHSGIVVFGEEHKDMSDVGFVRGLVETLADARECIFLFEVVPSHAPTNLLYDMPMLHLEGKKVPVLMPLDEDEAKDDFKKYQCSWSSGAKGRGIVYQIPFVDEAFTVRPCFHNICDQSRPKRMTENDLPNFGDHKRNKMLLNVANAHKIECFGIDLPGADFSLFDSPGAIDDPQCVQRHDYWNMLRDTWMAKHIAAVKQQNPDKLICVFVGSDHNEGLELGRVHRFHRTTEEGEMQEIVTTLNNGFCLDNANLEAPVVYVKRNPDLAEQQFELRPKSDDDKTHFTY